jgi:hypothetical protein
MGDYKITKEDFVDNGGYSAKYFLPHMIHFLNNKPNDITIDMYRYKMFISGPKSKIVLKCHYKKRSNKYGTILTPSYSEICTIKYTIPPHITTNLILQILSDSSISPS